MTDQNTQLIPTSWRETTLKEMAEINPTESLPKGILSKYVAMENLEPFSRKIWRYELKEFNGGMKFRNGDTLFARITPCLENGKTACVDILNEDEIGFGSTEYIVIREKKQVSDSKFLYYFAMSSFFRDVAIKSMSGTSGRQRVQTDLLVNTSFFVPLLPEQRAIASVLSSLDDKIELLREQNKTLEAIAQTLFNRWFVEFNFHDENGQPYRDSGGKIIDSELRKIPEGWRVDRLGGYIEIRGGSTPSTSNPDFWNGGINWTSPKDLSNSNEVFLLNTEKKITEEGLNQISSGLLPKYTLLLSSRAPIGYLAITAIETAINQGYIAFLPDAYLSNYFMYLWLDRNMNVVEGSANGSTFLEISKSSFRGIESIIPKKETLQKFDLIINPIFVKILSNICQIQTLSQLRDSLLPKLMKGEVRVKH
jgi:type I restriction enzyme, S subunit